MEDIMVVLVAMVWLEYASLAGVVQQLRLVRKLLWELFLGDDASDVIVTLIPFFFWNCR